MRYYYKPETIKQKPVVVSSFLVIDGLLDLRFNLVHPLFPQCLKSFNNVLGQVLI